jgi:hypothetical protein
MAIERNPNTPYDPDRLNRPVSHDPYTGEMRSRPPFEEDLQVDPELAEGPANNGKIALFALGIAIVLGAVFYGLNNSSVNQQNAATAPTSTTAQNSASTSPPAAPPGMRDVTPHAPNSEPGTTTGAAPANPGSAKQ